MTKRQEEEFYEIRLNNFALHSELHSGMKCNICAAILFGPFQMATISAPFIVYYCLWMHANTYRMLTFSLHIAEQRKRNQKKITARACWSWPESERKCLFGESRHISLDGMQSPLEGNENKFASSNRNVFERATQGDLRHSNAKELEQWPGFLLFFRLFSTSSRTTLKTHIRRSKELIDIFFPNQFTARFTFIHLQWNCG